MTKMLSEEKLNRINELAKKKKEGKKKKEKKKGQKELHNRDEE